MRRLLLALVVAMTGCSDSPAPTTGVYQNVSPCNGTLTIEDNRSGMHVEPGTDIQWTNNPPTSGSHYPTWAAWDRSYAQLPRGYYVHNAEHGGVIFLYHCDPDCPDVVASLLDAARHMTADSACISPITKRVIVTSDPLLPDGVQVAAVAWNAAYTASCFDPYVSQFAREHYAHAPEDFCNDGANLSGTPITQP
ncbi:MAG TPA: DUF3105 domain-containing protein [Kofleriaceae bacterium]|nr:DUF3105 domain-containing protein [Kofleriaceae bacterium]